MSEEEGKAVFAALRPLCVKVMSEPSVESLTALQAGVKTLPPSSIPPQLVDYLTLPLRAAIKRAGSSNERLLESSLLALAEIFSRVKDLNGWQLFHDLFSFLCMLLDPKMAKEAGFGVCSEDLLVSSLKALKALLLSTSSRSVCTLCSSKSPVMCHYIPFPCQHPQTIIWETGYSWALHLHPP